MHAWLRIITFSTTSLHLAMGAVRYVDRSDQITNNEERLNGEDDIIHACLFAFSVSNCISDNREWNGVEYEGIGIQKMFIPSRLSSDDCWCVVRLLLVCAMVMAPCLGVGEGTGWGLNEWFQGIRLSGAAEGVGCKGVKASHNIEY